MKLSLQTKAGVFIGLGLMADLAASIDLYGIDVGQVVCGGKAVSFPIDRPSPDNVPYIPVFFRTAGTPAGVHMSLGAEQASLLKAPHECLMECTSEWDGLCGLLTLNGRTANVTCMPGYYCDTTYRNCKSYSSGGGTMWDNDAQGACTTPCLLKAKELSTDILSVRTLSLVALTGRRLTERITSFVTSAVSKPKAWAFTQQPAEAVAEVAPERPADDAAPAFVPASPQAEEDMTSMLCEEFFLLDGRMPIDLPDSWQEAHEAFMLVCEDAGSPFEQCREAHDKIFTGFPTGSESFVSDAALCNRLMAWATVTYDAGSLAPRRLKSSGGGGRFVGRGGSGGAANGWNSGRTGSTYLGYTSGRAAMTYRSGYRTTAFGYAGVAVGTVFFMRGSMYRGGSYGRYQEDCDSSGRCPVSAASETLYRDDFFTFAHVPNTVQWPQTLNVYAVQGPAFERERLCEHWSADNATWTPPPEAGLFFGFGQAEVLEWEDDENVAGAIAAGVIIPVFTICFCAGLCIYLKRRKQRLLREQQERDNAGGTVEVYGQPVPQMPIVQGNVVQGTAVDGGKQ